jgi:hypothetical protein
LGDQNGPLKTSDLILSQAGYTELYFMQVRLVEMETPSPAADTVSTVRSLQLKDRAVLDKALRAFVSHIQAYAKHECNVILRLKGKTYYIEITVLCYCYVFYYCLFILVAFTLGRVLYAFPVSYIIVRTVVCRST